MIITQPRVVLIQKDDQKSRAWRGALPRGCNVDLRPIAGSPLRLPIALLGTLFSRRERLSGVIFRYLNDYPSLLKTLIRFSTEVATIVISRASGVRIGWICHNVDKESQEYYPRITNLRRRVICLASARVYVTSHLLLNEAARTLPVRKEKLFVASFGKFFSSLNATTVTENKELSNWVHDLRRQGVRVGLWIGSSADKSLSGLAGFLRFLVCSPPGSFAGAIIGVDESWILENVPGASRESLGTPYTRIIPSLRLGIDEWKSFDFIWKPCDDYSTTVTSLIAAEAGVPLVVYKNTYLASFVQHYGCGFAIDPGMLDVNGFVAQLSGLRMSEWSSAIFEDNRWTLGAAALISLLDD